MTATKLPLLSAVFLMQAVAEKALVPLLDFAGPEAAQKWQAVNDGIKQHPFRKTRFSEVGHLASMVR
jgi:hypothetical protein